MSGINVQQTNEKENNIVGFWFCNMAFVLERFSFYSVKWLIAYLLVASASKGGLGLDEGEGALASSAMVAWTYGAPIFGSFISDWLVGAKYLVQIGRAHV